MDYRQGQPLNSIDLIEECLTDIYRTRKASLRDKARMTEKKIKKRSEQHTSLKHTSHFFDEDESDEEVNNRNTKTETPHTPRAASNPPTPRQSKFATIEDKENDALASAAYDEFRAELCSWYTKNPTKRQDDEHRAEIADYLTELYMCQKLDPLPASRGVTLVRRQMSCVIEAFAATGELPSDFADWLANQSKERKQEIAKPAVLIAPLSLASNKSKAVLDTTERPLDILRKIGSKTPAATASADEPTTATPKEKMSNATKTMLEKKRIKDQYEAYMKHTKQQQVAKSSSLDDDTLSTRAAAAKISPGSAKMTDVPTEAEYEEHLAEIRSLISNIKENKGKE